MKKKIFGVVLVVIAFVLLSTVIYFGKDKKLDNNNDNDKASETNNGDKNSIEEKVESILSSMTLEEKVGQMLIIDFVNTEMTEKLKNFYNSIKPGGVIIMQYNYSTFDGTKKLISDLKSLSSVPLIVSTDQEGGIVQRFENLTDVKPTDIPDMFSLGKTGDVELAYNVGKIMALEMRTLGINVTHAPVVDIFSNPNNKVIGTRSFGTDADVVSKMSQSVARGLEENGVMSTFKHFPGHGDTETDSHKSLPVINKTYEELMNLELIPFKSAVDNGAKMIMTAHIALPNITGDNTPASLSKKIITDILRDDLGYKGLVVTDALNMGALTKNYSNEEIYLMAVEAGVDLLLMPTDSELAVKVIKENVSEERINESVRRILEFKYKYLENYEYTDKSVLGSEEHKKIIEKVISSQ